MYKSIMKFWSFETARVDHLQLGCDQFCRVFRMLETVWSFRDS